MADSTDKMNIIVTFRNAAKTGMRTFKKDLTEIDKGAAKAAKSMKLFYTAALSVGTLFASGKFFGSALQTFAQFDDAMRAAGAVTNATAEEMKAMTEIAKEMGRETRYTATQSAEALKFMGMAGFEASKAIEALPSVLQLAAAGNLDLASAADISTNILTAFGLEADRLARVNDVLVGAFTSTNVNLIEIGEAFKMVGAVGKGVGSDFEDLIATIGKLGNAGIKGTMGGVAMKNAIEALLNPTAKEAKMMKELEARLGGVSLKVKDAEGDFIGFTEIVKQLNAANVDGIEALKMFGLRAGPAMAALMNQGKEGTEDLRKALKEMGGVAAQIATEMESGIGGEMRRTIAVLEGFRIALGEALGPEAVEFLVHFQGAVRALTESIKIMAERGDFTYWGEVAIDVFDKVTWAVQKTYYAIAQMTSMINAMVAASTGDFATAEQAMIGWMENTQKLFGTYQEEAKETTKVVTKAITDEMKKGFVDSAKDDGPIGKGTKAVKDKVNEIVETVSDESRLKAALTILQAEMDKQAAILESHYNQRIITLGQYYDKQIEMARKVAEAEIAILRNKLEEEDSISKRAEINARIKALETTLQTDIINLNEERRQKQEEIEAKALRTQQNLNKKRLQAEKAIADQQARIREEGTTTLDVAFAKELADLQSKQNAELNTITTYHDAVIKALRDRKATELEIEKAFEAKRKALAEQTDLQNQEREQMMANQSLRLTEYRLTNLQNLAQGTANMFENLYELTGEKNKALFYAAKAAAVAEATINIAQGVTKALAQGGIFGIATGAMVATAGAVQIATIMSQGLAEGGEVAGSSPHSKADNIPIRATAGEYMQPVSSVNYYGKDVMEAIRTKSIPRSIFAGYSSPGIISKGRNLGFAEGGLIPGSGSVAGMGSSSESGINIINVTDPSMIDQYLSTTAGQDAVLNVLGARPEMAQRMIKGV